MIAGATVEEKGFDTAVTAGGVHELLREAYRLLPDVAEMELVEAIMGMLPLDAGGDPILVYPQAVDSRTMRARTTMQRDPRHLLAALA